jgi:solute carrier family 39 (zinc transporter), member 1/2/3
MSLLSLKLIIAALVFVVAIIAAAWPFARRQKGLAARDFPVGEALAAGVFLGAALLHLLPDAVQRCNQLCDSYPWAYFVAGGAFLFLLLIEHVGREFYHAKNCQNHAHKHSAASRDGRSFALIAVFMLSIHSFFAGAALGLSASFASLLIVTIAILAHKWAASFALAVEICKSDLSQASAIVAFLLFAIMVPLGIFFGNHAMAALSSYPLVAPLLLSFAAGTFLYLGTLHGLQRAVMIEKCCNLRHFAFVILGFLIMAVVAVWT